jgi:hypothetical protein
MQIVFNKETAVVGSMDGIHVFNTINIEKPEYNCPEEVVDKVVEMFNEGYDLSCIDECLLYANCTTEAREVMVEGLYKIMYQPKLNIGNDTFDTYTGELCK